MSTPHTLELHVSGMSCQHCVKAVTHAIQSQDPQATVQISLPEGRTVVTTTLTPETVRQLIEDEGYVVQP
ncbi:MAG: heavy-metal-associated domain-containing protein [Aquabacterium sp.]|jgi:copper chaperone